MFPMPAASLPPLISRRDMLAGFAGIAGLQCAPEAWAAALAAADGQVASSPDGRLRALLVSATEVDHPPAWAATFDGRSVLQPSNLSLRLEDGTTIGPGATLSGLRRTSFSGHWSPPYGIAARYDESHEQIVATFDQPGQNGERIAFEIVLRAYNAGIAIRYRLLGHLGAPMRIAEERTEFRFAPGATVYSSRDEGEYFTSSLAGMNPTPDPGLTASTDRGPLADTPVTVATADGLLVSIGESDRRHYPRMMVTAAGPDALVTRLMHFPGRATGYSGPGETAPDSVFAVDTPFATPWRSLLIAETAAAMIEKAGFVPTLATANQLGDTSWIRPGRAFRIRKPYTNENARRCIAFAAARKLEYVELDAQWYGDGTDAGDATVPLAGLDMVRLVSDAREQGLRVILYVDRVPATRQLDAIVRTYKAWGVAGIKFGFIWEGRQRDVEFIETLVRTCGEHQLLANLHDDLRPAGLERTFPNYIALEGVRGNEHFPTARHNVTLPFTRCLSGPIDYTICNAHPRNQTTRAHQIAMAVVYYNPLAFLYWYDTPERYAGREWPDLAFFDECPTSWDESLGLMGSIGDYVVVARRSGRRWFVGAMTNETSRILRLPLSFLGRGRWQAQIFRDGPPRLAPNDTPLVVAPRIVSGERHIDLHLAPSGGQAIILAPAA